jgi:hypothetical protein
MRYVMQEHTASAPSAAKPAGAAPPRQGERSPAGAAEFVICDHTIDTCCEDGKQLLGRGDDAVRGWTGWHHPMTLVILAHFFVVRMRLRLKKAPAVTLPQVVMVLVTVLPLRECDTQLALDILASHQQRNHAAYLSQRKRRIALVTQRE